MTNEEIYLIMQPIVTTVTGLSTVILADPDQSAPSGEYAVIRPQASIDERGQANIYQTTASSDTVTIEVRPQIINEVVVEFYRGGALSYAKSLKEANKRPDISRMLYRAQPQPIGWNRTGNVLNLTALQSKNWEQRAQISIYIMYEFMGDPVTIESIERIPLQAQNSAGTVISTGEVVTPDAP